MLTQSKATIYLSGERSLQETELYRALGTVTKESGKAFGTLVSLEEVTLAGGNSFIIDAGENYDYVILPIIGTVYFESGRMNNLVNPGQSLFISPTINNDLIITNPYDDELVNFLQLGFKQTAGNFGKSEIFSFDLDNNKNQMIALGNATAGYGSCCKISIGKFDGRAETIYKPASAGNGVFVFVITGAFEVQYRLMEAKDGLALWDMHEMELEALSNEAILLTIELPLL